MIHTETKFAYRHKPTGKWVYFNVYFDDELWHNDQSPYVYEMEFVENFSDASLEAEHLLRSDLKISTMNGEKYGKQNFEEFELVEVKVTYEYNQH